LPKAYLHILMIDRVLMGRDTADIGVIDTASFVRDDFTTHGLHLNSRGERRLTYLIAERISGGHVSSVSNIPVITHAGASHFLAQNLKHKGA
jgi:hypothetical protein